VTSTNSDLVVAAVSDKNFHTISGIAAKTGLDNKTVAQLLRENKKTIRMSYATDKEGNLLYINRTNRLTFREALSALQQAMGLV
jgi:hypothetical protein